MREQGEVVAARLRAVFEAGRVPAAPVSTAPSGPPSGPPVSSPWSAPPAVSGSGPPAVPASGPLGADFTDRSPLAWSDLVPSWPDDVELHDGPDQPRRPPVTESSTAPIDPSAWSEVGPGWVPSGDRVPAGPDPASGIRPAWAPPADDTDPPAGPNLASGAFSSARGNFAAFGPARGRLAAFDPGRHGAKALAAVAVVAVIIAAYFAWRARPRVDPVAPPPLVAATGAVDPVPAAAASAPAEVVVSVAGKVGKPGLVRLPPGARVADALAAAGGAKPGVDVALLNLARKVVDGELILVGVTPPPGTVVAGPAPPAAAGRAPGGPINLNTATLADLDGLPGVGPVLAQRILDARDARGGFTAVSDLRKVEGIGDSRYEQLKDLVTV